MVRKWMCVKTSIDYLPVQFYFFFNTYTIFLFLKFEKPEMKMLWLKERQVYQKHIQMNRYVPISFSLILSSTTLGLFYQMSTYVKTIFTTPFKNDEDGELKQQHQNQISVWPWPTFSLILKCTLLIFLITTS